MSNLERKAKIYRLVLEHLETKSNHNAVHAKDVEEELGLTTSEVRDAFQYLLEKGYVEDGFSSVGNRRASITAQGRDALFHLLKPATQPIAPVQIQNNFHGTANVQQGPDSTMNITMGLQAAEVMKLMEQLRNHMGDVPAERQDEAQELIQELELVFQDPKPKITKAKAFLAHLLQLVPATTAFAADALALVEALKSM